MAQDRKPREEAGRAAPDSEGPRSAEIPTPPTPTPLELRRIAASDRYTIEAVLGSGGMGKVYKAFDHRLQRAVALKFLRGGGPELERRFLREARAQARIDHPNVCKVFEVGNVGEEPYIAMQYVEGPTLRDAALALSLREKLAVLRDVAEAV